MMNHLTNEEKVKKCIEFFDNLKDVLSKNYEVVASCNADISSYLIPKGSIEDLSYFGKPAKSFRFSDHWNWFSNLKKNPDPHYIQCFSVDAPWANRRTSDKATKPIHAIQVGYFDSDNRYHAVYGEMFDRKTKTWDWLEADPATVVDWLGLA